MIMHTSSTHRCITKNVLLRYSLEQVVDIYQMVGNQNNFVVELRIIEGYNDT